MGEDFVSLSAPFLLAFMSSAEVNCFTYCRVLCAHCTAFGTALVIAAATSRVAKNAAAMGGAIGLMVRWPMKVPLHEV